MTKFNVKIFGAGSIGNHLAYACRGMDWDVTICDPDSSALDRTKKLIYPERYGSWDDSIRLCTLNEIPDEKFDFVIIGTPPDSHIKIALDVLSKETPKGILIEKPLCTPDLEGAQDLYTAAKDKGVNVFVGYNHTLGFNTVTTDKLLEENKIGNCITINGGFMEHWGGIFKAHPWLSGPEDTYLGYMELGGGACGEHSHAINIWQHFANSLGKGRIVEVSARMDIVDEGNGRYDRICDISVKTEEGLVGTIIQDVVTQPSRKTMLLQGDKGFIEWHVAYESGDDAVISKNEDGPIEKNIIKRLRTDDFRLEIEHIGSVLAGDISDSPISIERGLDTMMVIAATNMSHEQNRVMKIDYSKGYNMSSITPI